MADPVKRPATYQDVIDAPSNMVAEIAGGELRLSPRPGAPHTAAASVLGQLLGPPFQFGSGGPGGWLILDEPELHLDEDILVPDLAGWRRHRMPHVPAGAAFTIAPDWVCEVLSPSTAINDRSEKLPIYARAGIEHAWLVDPRYRTVEVFRRQGSQWLLLCAVTGDVRVRAEPFDAIELDLSHLWAYSALPPPGSRASEYGAEYVTK
ncbi:MAG TPA: Uma2 family endonuclease [Kofleriaceae bacterium]|nr:Uma2 family endonuclease [Kofleriaceae bacterium]